MSTSVVTLIAFGIFALIIAIDIHLYRDNVPGNSFTQIIRAKAKKYLIIAWAIGFLMGYLTSHFFDPEEQERATIASTA